MHTFFAPSYISAFSRTKLRARSLRRALSDALSPPLLALLLTLLLTLLLSAPLGGVPGATASAAAAALPDFEEDISLGLGEGKLRALGAKACPEAALCLNVRWGEQEWKAVLRLHAGALDVVELHPRGQITGAAAREQLEEFALAPVRVKAGDVQCDVFALVRQGKSADKAVDICADKLDKLGGQSAGAQCSVWYVDEDQLEELVRAGSLENAASQHARSVAARLSMTPGGVEVGYGHLGSLLQPSLKP